MTVVDARAALERGRPVVLIRPPAVQQARDLWEIVSIPSQAGPTALIVTAPDDTAAEWAAAAPAGLRVHAVTGFARTSRVLTDQPPQVLAGAVKDLATLVERSALKLELITSVVLAWPEALVSGAAAAPLDTLLGEARDAHRIILSWNPTLLGDFLERHARRALVIGSLPVDENARPLPPVCRARYAIVPSFRRSIAAREALDLLNADVALCADLPTRDELAALARLGKGEPVVFISASQLPYLRSIATLTPLALPSGADRALDRAEVLRERITRRLTTGDVDAELALLGPLFERFDPAEVAGAVLAIQREDGWGKRDEALPPVPTDSARVKVFVNVGKKDHVTAKDLVGAMIREVGVAKGDIGRIEVRETFSLVEVASGIAERAVRGLPGVTIRGKRVAARLDRDR